MRTPAKLFLDDPMPGLFGSRFSILNLRTSRKSYSEYSKLF